jgi:type II secretory ATPase GspE/PulE/Tfp pilus assembly ATPase PilB-like protein
MLPLELGPETLRVAVAGDPNPDVLDDLRRSYGKELELVPVEPEAIIDAIRLAFAGCESVVELVRDLDAEALGLPPGTDESLTDLRDLANQPPVVRYVNLLLREANQARASDVHLEATREGLRVRLRIDGVLSEMAGPPGSMHAAIVSRIKLLAELDIAERRLPQDGRIRVRLEARELDLRISTVPTLHGESVVLRLLDHAGRPAELEELGMAPEALAQFRVLAQRPHGILLSTGPTGSGKTTTLYAALGLRNREAEKIVTVEEPVEYHLAGVTQVPVSRKAGLGFAEALRNILRQDPDVLMVGEMRDGETASIAVQAAMTGHLVFSTLHTNDAVSAIPRLTDLGVEPYMVAATVEAVLAQRLVRRICGDCRTRYKPDPATVALLAGRPVGSMTLERGAGCGGCRNTGFLGRTGLFELLVMTEAMKEALSRGADLSQLRALARESGMSSLRHDGWAKVQAGITTIEEVMRVAGE